LLIDSNGAIGKVVGKTDFLPRTGSAEHRIVIAENQFACREAHHALRTLFEGIEIFASVWFHHLRRSRCAHARGKRRGET
jgi:hypothetical protein